MTPEPSTFLDYVKEWQTLIAGVFALATFVAIAYQAWLQKQEFLRIEEKENLLQRKQAAAAKAGLPFALSSIHEYLEEYLSYIHWRISGSGCAPNSPIIPERALRDILNSIQYWDGESAEQFSELIRQLQVLQVRFGDLERSTEPKENDFIYTFALPALKVMVGLNRAFNVVDGNTDVFTLEDITQSEITTSARVISHNNRALRKALLDATARAYDSQ